MSNIRQNPPKNGTSVRGKGGKADPEIDQDEIPEDIAEELEAEVTDTFNWLDQFTLSRPKRNINRDFSDGVLFAELLNCHFPKLVSMHSIPAASSVAQKKENWELLNRKVLPRIGLKLNPQQILLISNSQVGGIEVVFADLRKIILEMSAASEEAAAKGDGNGAENPSANSPREDACLLVDGNPERGVVYKGVKMVPASLVEQKEERIKELEGLVNDTRKKVHRQETMVALKDEHLKKLTTQLEEFRKHLQQKTSTASSFNQWYDPTGFV